MPDCNDCPVLPRVDALEEANKQHSSTHREIFGRLRELESKTAVQDTMLTTMNEKLEDIKTDQKSILQKIGTLEAKPGKRWEGLSDKVIWFIFETILIVAAIKVGLR